VRRLGLSLVLLGAAFLPTGAQAQVVVDPDSPAGKEYAIPLEQKRDQAVGGKEHSQSNPFGEGISKPGARSSSKKGSGSSGPEGKKDGDKDEFDTTGALSDASSGGNGGGSGGGGGPDEAGANGALLTSGIALAVLLLGGGVAFLMRRGAFGTDA
jgi:hypothetical protein